MRYLIVSALLMAGMAFATPAAAEKYKCNCYKNSKADIESYSDIKMTCVDTFTDFNSSSAVQETQIKVYVDGANKVQTDNDARIRFRPRDGKCLAAVYDGNAATLRWAGLYCNNDSYKEIGPFNLDELPPGKKSDGTPTPPTYTATYRAETDSKKYKGFLLYFKNQDGKKYMNAMCVEDK